MLVQASSLNPSMPSKYREDNTSDAIRFEGAVCKVLLLWFVSWMEFRTEAAQPRLGTFTCVPGTPLKSSTHIQQSTHKVHGPRRVSEAIEMVDVPPLEAVARIAHPIASMRYVTQRLCACSGNRSSITNGQARTPPQAVPKAAVCSPHQHTSACCPHEEWNQWLAAFSRGKP